MKKLPAKTDRKQTEETLRRHIRRILTNAGFKTPAPLLRKIEDEVFTLFESYSRAPKAMREEVYSKGRKRVLDALRSY
ncbi:MAG TPA: hypothetical protein VM934_14960 [Pyrinomonadaceae bacterium]|nr:hypothetical protein [Pyrinomonadaceae bacterium]